MAKASSGSGRHVESTLRRVAGLEKEARQAEDGSELFAVAVLLCAGKVQEITSPESVHVRAVHQLLDQGDIGSPDVLRRVRGVLRAADQIEA